jgi:hypothetical protein
MNRVELVEKMCSAWGPNWQWFLSNDPRAAEDLATRMAAVLDVIEPIIRADERARIVARLIPSPPEDAS